MRKLRLSRSRSIRADPSAGKRGRDKKTDPGAHRESPSPFGGGIRSAAFGALAALLMGVTPAAAHGFGQRYDLPLPLSLYLWGAAAAVAVSFVIVGLFVRDVQRAETYRHVDLLASQLAPLAPGVALALRLLAVALLLLTILSGFWGNQNPYRNIAPTLVWIIGWVGLAYVSAFVGNLWAVINPWRTIFGAFESFYAWLAHSGELSLRRRYPRALGVWPAVILLLVFSWI